MFLAEAQWFRARLQELAGSALFPLLNVGSGNDLHRRVRQPWIDRELFAPIRERDGRVLHMDIMAGPGIDVVGDLCDEASLKGLKDFGIRSVLCSNVLEHVSDRNAFCVAMLQLLPSGGVLLISCPNAYPYHAAPIDTMFRPELAELRALFPATEMISGEILDVGSFIDEIRQQPLLLPRLFLPFYRPRRWYGLLHRLPWLFRTYRASCLVLRKL